MKRLSLFIILMVVLSACNLATGSDDEPTNTPQVISQNPTRTTQPVMTNTSQPPTATVTPRAIVTAQVPPTVVNCTPRADWTVRYTVVSGDTLGTIAQRVNSTISALQQGNCLANANVISVGQSLRVPQSPLPPTATRTPLVPTATFTPPSTQPIQVGDPLFHSHLTAEGGAYQLLRDDRVLVTWLGVPTDQIGTATFAFTKPGWQSNPGVNSTAIAYDNNPADGVSYDWAVTPNLQHTEVIIFAQNKTTGQYYYSNPVYLHSVPTADMGCFIRLTADASIYADGGAGSAPVGTLKAEEVHQILGQSFNGWYAIIPELAYQTLVPVVVDMPLVRWLPRDGMYKIDGAGCSILF